MTTIRNGTPENYFSQRNNLVDPLSSCNVTAMVDALAQAGWALPEGEGQPEDRLFRFIERDQECLQLWASLDPRGVIPPNQWMAVLALGTNRWMETSVVQWSESTDPVRMILHLSDGGTCVVSGMFPGTKGHVVALVGVSCDDKVRPYSWIIDDPYGDYHGKYADARGSAVEMSDLDFRTILKPQNEAKKWCHFIRPENERGL